MAYDLNQGADSSTRDQVERLAHAGAGRLEDGGHGNTAWVGEPLEVDHLLSQGDDEGDAQDSSNDAAQDHQGHVEGGVVEDEQGGDREHHSRRGRVHGAGDALVDIVLDDAAPAQDPPEDTEPENGSQLGAFDGKSEDEARIPDADGDERAEKIADKHGGQGELGIGASSNGPRVVRQRASSCLARKAPILNRISGGGKTFLLGSVTEVVIQRHRWQKVYNAAMQRVRVSTVLLITLVTSIAVCMAAGPDEPAGFFSEVLPNGLRVSIFEDPTSTVVATQVWYHVGAAHEQRDGRGLAHLFEHLMFGGTELHGRQDYEDLHHRHGGYENAFTTADETVYVSTLPPGPHLEVIEMEADRMRNLSINRKNLGNEKRIVTEELRLRTENDPYTRLLVAAQKALLGKHPYAFDPSGSKEDVAAATVESCRGFYDAYYHPNRAHLVVAGPVEARATLDAVRKHFGSIPSGGTPPPDVPPLFGWSYPSEVVLEEDLPPVETAIMGFPIADAGSEDYWALLLLGQLLGGGAVDPFEEELVKRRRKAVAAGVTQLFFRRGGAMVFYMASLPYRRKATAFRLMEKTREQLSQLDWLTEDSLLSAKRTLRRRELLAAYYPSIRADAIGRSWWWLGDEKLAFGKVSRIDAVTLDQVAEAYRKYVGEPEPVRLWIRPEHVPLMVRLFGWLYPLVSR